MITKKKQHISISLSKEHGKNISDIKDCFVGVDLDINADLYRFSIGDLPMQIIIFLGWAVLSGVTYDLIKAGIVNFYKKFKSGNISIRGENGIMFSINQNLEVKPIVIPERMSEFDNIKNIDDLIKYLNNLNNKLPNGWIETTAENYCLKVADGTHDSPKQSLEGKLLVTSKNLTNGQLDLSSSYKISYEDFELVNKRSKVDKWDILLGMIGTVGEVCLISDEPDFAIKNVGLFKCGEEIKAKFLYYYLKSSIGQNYILSRLNGTTQKYITLGELRQFPIIHPKDLKEQQTIASILSSFDDKIELLREQNETLEKIGQEIFKEWFGKYKVGDELPEGWRVGKLGEILKFIKGKKPNDTSDIFIDGYIPQILIETFDSGKVTYANPKNVVFINENDLIMVMDGASSGRLEIGYNGIVGSTLSKIEVDDKLKLTIYAFLKSKFKEINDGTTGSSIPHTDKAKIFNFNFFITDENYINDFNKLYGSFLNKILDNKKQIQTLSKTRDELLPRLMRGEVRVV